MTSVGFASGSIGPPIKVKDAGLDLGEFLDVKAAAAKASGTGWQTAITFILGERIV